MKVLLGLLWIGAFHCWLILGCRPLDIDRGLLDAIRQVESDGDIWAIGDENLRDKAYGPYQIRMPYYLDAVKCCPSLENGGKSFKDVNGGQEYSEEVISCYMGKYANSERLGHQPTAEDIARIHNGGPNGHKSTSTDAYWTKLRQP